MPPFQKKKQRWPRLPYGWIALLLAASWTLYALWPSPVPVETALAQRGLMFETIPEKGETRAHERYIVAAPVPGRLLRIELEEGTAVKQEDVVASIEPAPLGERERQESMARIAAAEAAHRQSEARLAHARGDFEMAKSDRERAQELARRGVISRQTFEQVQNAEAAGAAELEAAKFAVLVAASEVKLARASLTGLEAQGNSGKPIPVRSPVGGRVLRVLEKSERVVPAGLPLLLLGDPTKLEVVVDALSTDAVKIRPGSQAWLEGGGGNQPLRARVRLVEPSGFTKVSALGVEEKRVNVILDFVDPPGPLSDGYRVEARIVVWVGENILKVPASAVFRREKDWYVFVLEKGRARLRPVQTGHRNEDEVQILGGIEDGAAVLTHPPRDVRDGRRVLPIAPPPRTAP